MTLATTVNRSEQNGDGATTSFPFSFTVLLEGDLDVYVDGVLQTITTHYTVGGTLPGTGTVDFVTAPPSGTGNVIIIRAVDLTQTLDLTAAEFPPETVEQTFDKVVMMVQQINEILGRTLKLATTSTFEDLDVPDPEVDKLLGWATGPVLANFAQASITNSIIPTAFAETILDDASASAVLTTLGVTAFIKTLLDDATAAAARTTLGAAPTFSAWVDSTGSRAVDTVYENTSGVDSMVCITGVASVSGAAMTFDVRVENVNPPTVVVGSALVQEAGALSEGCVTVVVPAGHFVKMTITGSTALKSWAEAPAIQ